MQSLPTDSRARAYHLTQAVRFWTLLCGAGQSACWSLPKSKIYKELDVRTLEFQVLDTSLSHRSEHDLDPDAGRTLCAPPTAQDTRIHHDCRAYSRLGNRRQRGSLHAGERDPDEESSCGQTRKPGQTGRHQHVLRWF